MEPNKEGLEPQKPPETVVPTDTVSLSKQEFEDLKHKADVSSQNFERLKKAEQESEELRVQLESNISIEGEPGAEVMGKLKSEISDIKQKLAQSEVLSAHPQLKDVWSEFESFRDEPDNKGMHMKTAAKAFLIEKGMFEPQRKGLERPTGGGHVPILSDMNVDEVKKLRETNFRKYQEMLNKGQIKV